MAISSLNQTLSYINSQVLSEQSLIQPKTTAMDIFLSVITIGIYALYKRNSDEIIRNEILDLGAEFMQWNPDRPDNPLIFKSGGRTYEVFDLPHAAGVQLLEYGSGNVQIVNGASLEAIRKAIMSDALKFPEFAKSLEERGEQLKMSFALDLRGMLQQQVNACSDTCVNMILKYHGLDYPLLNNDRLMFDGIFPLTLVEEKFSEKLAIEAIKPAAPLCYSFDEIKKGLQTGPVLCRFSDHAVIVYGFDSKLNRVDIFCPLLGSCCCSLDVFNKNLDWDDPGILPLARVVSKFTYLRKPLNSGKPEDPDLRPSFIDKLGVKILKMGYSMGSGWLQSPEAFESAR